MASSTTSRPRSPSPPSEPDVFAISPSLIPERTQKPAGISELDFDGLLSPPLVLREDLQEGCGGQLWPAGMTLAKYLLKNQATTLRDKHIIEIGAGGGLVGLAVGLGCQTTRPLLLTDQQPMFGLIESNIQLNKLQSEVFAQVYDWGTKPSPSFSTASGHPDIVLAADCVYFEPAFPLLLQTLEDLVGPETICFFCFKKRRKADMRFIRDMMKRLIVTEISYEEREKDKRDAVFLYKITAKTNGLNKGGMSKG